MTPYDLLRAIARNTFTAEDFSDSTVQRAIKDGLVEWDRDRLALTTQGEAELRDFDKPEDPRDRLEDV